MFQYADVGKFYSKYYTYYKIESFEYVADQGEVLDCSKFQILRFAHTAFLKLHTHVRTCYKCIAVSTRKASTSRKVQLPIIFDKNFTSLNPVDRMSFYLTQVRLYVQVIHNSSAI